MTTQEQIERELQQKVEAARAGKITAFFSVDIQEQEGTKEPLTTITIIPSTGTTEELTRTFEYHMRGIADVLRSAMRTTATKESKHGTIINRACARHPPSSLPNSANIHNMVLPKSIEPSRLP